MERDRHEGQTTRSSGNLVQLSPPPSLRANLVVPSDGIVRTFVLRVEPKASSLSLLSPIFTLGLGPAHALAGPVSCQTFPAVSCSCQRSRPPAVGPLCMDIDVPLWLSPPLVYDARTHHAGLAAWQPTRCPGNLCRQCAAAMQDLAARSTAQRSRCSRFPGSRSTGSGEFGHRGNLELRLRNTTADLIHLIPTSACHMQYHVPYLRQHVCSVEGLASLFS